jgi:hypothetical protein
VESLQFIFSGEITLMFFYSFSLRFKSFKESSANIMRLSSKVCIGNSLLLYSNHFVAINQEKKNMDIDSLLTLSIFKNAQANKVLISEHAYFKTLPFVSYWELKLTLNHVRHTVMMLLMPCLFANPKNLNC